MRITGIDLSSLVTGADWTFTPLEALEAVEALPDASGEFTGYFDSGAPWMPWLNAQWRFGMASDECSPDTSQPYPF